MWGKEVIVSHIEAESRSYGALQHTRHCGVWRVGHGLGSNSYCLLTVTTLGTVKAVWGRWRLNLWSKVNGIERTWHVPVLQFIKCKIIFPRSKNHVIEDRRHERKSPPIYSLCTRWKWIVSLSFRPFYPREMAVFEKSVRSQKRFKPSGEETMHVSAGNWSPAMPYPCIWEHIHSQL